MKLDEFAFVNQQLAGMLKSGQPLEGALRRLCASLDRGDLKAELSALEADLAKGTPLRDALPPRQLPEFYKRMMLIGAQANDLPGVLLLLADYYQRLDALWTRLRGLLVYPLIVLVVATGLSVVLGFLLDAVSGAILTDPFATEYLFETSSASRSWYALRHVPTVVMCILTVAAFAVIGLPGLRRKLRWRLPGFREAALAQLAAGFAMLLRGGCPLGESLALLRELEQGSPVADELKTWGERLAAGQGELRELSAGSRVFPPLFMALASESGPDLAKGFGRVADTFQARAAARAEALLYSALPVSALALGIVIALQLTPVFHMLIRTMNALGGSN
ncbi:MAG: type II secretion system F family protein [Verrucomicrobia bacterium]|nr:type II secretion system F family protein [Verrucomicrobiota bacterium]